MDSHESQEDPIVRMDHKGNIKMLRPKRRTPDSALVVAAKQFQEGEIDPYELVARFLQALKQSDPVKPLGSPLPEWEGQVEITDEDIEEAIADWDAKAPKEARGLLVAEGA